MDSAAQGKYSEAEKTFREVPEKHPRSGRTPFGLTESLKGEGKIARLVLREYERAWSSADVRLEKEGL